MNQKVTFGILVALFIIILCQQNTFAKLPQELFDRMATREMRYHHFLWHNIRNLWYDLDKKTQKQITKLGWAPPRPAYTKSGAYDQENNSGEDFLFMHRQLIEEANRIMKKNNKKKLTGFKTIPAPGDKTYPVPRGGENDNYEKWKSDDFYWKKIKSLEEKFTNPEYLRNVSLGKLGAQLEFTIHNYLHIRFSNTTSMPNRPSSSEAMPYIDKKWDDPKYDWLLDTYASHVNPIFWKIHIWVDDRVEDWRKANNLKTINWKGNWVGGPISVINDLKDTTSSNKRMLKEEHKHNICVMEKAVRALLKTRKCFYYYCYV